MDGRPDEASFRELAEHSRAVLWSFSASWDEVLFVNPAYESVFGRSIERLREQPDDFLRAVHPDDRDRVREAMATLGAGEPVDIEFNVNEAEDFGRRVWVEGWPIRDGSGAVVRVAGIGRDVTERRAREQELARYETIVEATGDPVYTLDRDGRFTYVNDALVELVGRPADDLLGRHASAVLSTEDVARGRALIRELLEGDADRGTYELALRTADGRTVPCENHVALLPADDGFRGTVGVLRDISARRERERELRRQVDRFEAIFEAIPEPLVHVRFDEDGEPLVRRINSAFAETFGYPSEALRGRSINDAIVPPDRLEAARAIDERARTGEPVTAEVRRAAADGLRDFRFRVSWFEDLDAPEAIGVYVDLTDQKRRQRELERQNARLDEFASVVSHDLRNPLNVIAGRLELARETGEASHFEAIEGAVDRMTALIDDLLALARAGETVDDLEVVDLSAVVDGCWGTVATADATLENAVDRDVLADESRLRQLLENLFRNAVDHAGDDVAVRVGPSDDGFFVEDDGPGVPAAERERVFESGYSTAPNGAGFGLRIVRTIAEAHGWDVRVQDGALGGARFAVTGVRFA